MNYAANKGYVNVDDLDYIDDTSFIVYIPKNFKVSILTYSTSLGEDNYYYARVYSFGVLYVRDYYAFRDSLFRALGEPERELYYNSMDDLVTIIKDNKEVDVSVDDDLDSDPDNARTFDIYSIPNLDEIARVPVVEDYEPTEEDFPYDLDDICREYPSLISNNYESCGPAFIMPDGRFILSGDKFDTHEDFAIDTLLKLGDFEDEEDIENIWDMDEVLNAFTKYFDLVRVNDGSRKDIEDRAYFVIPKNSLTSGQQNALLNYLDTVLGNKHRNRTEDILAYVGRNVSYKMWDISDANNTSDKILDDVKFALSRGFFGESLKEMSGNDDITDERSKKRKSPVYLYRGVTDRSFSKHYDALAGLFFGTNRSKVSGWGDVKKYLLKSDAKIYSDESSDAFCTQFYNKEYPELKKYFSMYFGNVDINCLNDFTKLSKKQKDIIENNVEKLAGKQFCWYDVWTWCLQLVAKLELEKQGYDGANWSMEDAGNYNQYQIWNLDVLKSYDGEVESLDEDLQETDSEGNKLSKEQVEFFKGSKVRDDAGKLLVVYHGTNASFNTFEKGDIGFHFGTKGQADYVVKDRLDGKGHVDAYYLNIHNPALMYDFGDTGPYTIAYWWYEQSFEDYGSIFEFDMTKEELAKINKVFKASGGRTFGTGKDTDIEDDADAEECDHVESYNSQESKILRDILKARGYDGIVYQNNFEDSDTLTGDLSYIAFDSNQIKRIDNKNPTNSSNINEEVEATDKEILDDLDKTFGQEEVYMWSTYILPNGHLLNPDNAQEYFDEIDEEPGYEHYDYDDYLLAKYHKDYQFIDKYCMKMNVAFPYISFPKNRPTSEQQNAFRKILEHADEFDSELDLSNLWDIFGSEEKAKQLWNHSIGKLVAIYTPFGDAVYDLGISSADDILKDINKAYATGHLFTEELNEAKEDKEKFINWLIDAHKEAGMNQELATSTANHFVDMFLNLKQRIKSPYNDFYYWMKNSTQNDFIDYINKLSKEVEDRKQAKQKEKDGAELIYSDDTWKVYHITNYEASAKYGKGTKWCITGTKRWNDGEDGKETFLDYHEKNHVEFYFFIKNGTEKYALAVYPGGKAYEIFNAEDVSIAYIPEAPKIEGLPDVSTKDDKKVLINAIASDKISDDIVLNAIEKLANYNSSNDDYDLVFALSSEAVASFMSEMIPDCYLEYCAVRDGRLSKEEYETITGDTLTQQDIDDFFWYGDLPEVNVDENKFKTKKEACDPKNYQGHKYWYFFLDKNSWSSVYDLYWADDKVGLYNSIRQLLDFTDMYSFLEAIADIILTEVKKGNISKDDIVNLGVSSEYIDSLKLNEDLDNTKVIDAIKKEFGVSHPVPRCFILEDGSFISTPKDREVYNPHSSLDAWLKKNNLIDDNARHYYFSGLHSITCNGFGEFYCLINENRRPTDAQFESLRKWLDKYFVSNINDRGFQVVLTDDKLIDVISQIYNPDEITVDEIIKKIKRFYTTGKLREEIDGTHLIDYIEDAGVKVSKDVLSGSTYLDENGYFIFSSGSHGNAEDRITSYYKNDVDLGKQLNHWITFNTIQLNSKFNEKYIQISKQPNEKQYKQLLRWLDKYLYENGSVEVNYYESPLGKYLGNKTYSSSNTSPDDIIKNIKRFYTTGKLVENKLDEMQGKGEISNAKIKKYINDCINEMRKINFFADNDCLTYDDIDFEEGDTLRTFGTMKLPTYHKGNFTLILNRHMFDEPEEAIKNTIYHELCHYVVMKYAMCNDYLYEKYPGEWYWNSRKFGWNNFKGHGSAWKNAAYKVGSATGQDITRTNNYEMHTGVGDYAKDKYNYIVKCKHCGNEFKYTKRTRFITDVLNGNGHVDNWWCNCKDGTKSHDFEILKGK